MLVSCGGMAAECHKDETLRPKQTGTNVASLDNCGRWVGVATRVTRWRYGIFSEMDFAGHGGICSRCTIEHHDRSGGNKGPEYDCRPERYRGPRTQVRKG